MKKLLIVAAMAACVNVIAQNPMLNQDVKTASGLGIRLTEQTQNEKPKPGDKVKVHYTGTLTNGKKFDSSVDRGTPFEFQLGKGQVIQGWDEGIALLRKGEKATLTIPPNLGYGDRAMGDAIPAGSTLIFEVELIDFSTPPAPQFLTQADGKPYQKTASGLEYIVVEQGTGAKAEAGKTVRVHYTGYFEDKSVFDSSYPRQEPIEFPLGKGYVIKGWDEGIGLMNVGGKYRLKIPYDLGYGEGGRPPVIPAKATLYFDVELLEVK